MLCPDFAKSGRNNKNLMGPILFLYYGESLEPSNLNSKLFRFHSAHPNLHGTGIGASLHRPFG